MIDDRSILSADFAAMVGGSVDELTSEEVGFLDDGGLTYRNLTPEELSDVLAGIERDLEGRDMPVSGPGMHALWERNWAAQLEAVIGSDDDTANRKIVPEFIQDRDIVRLDGEFVTTRTLAFELNLANLFRKWLFRRYFSDVDWIGDFGAGSGLNLGFLSDLFPETTLRGFDWSESAVGIIDHIGEIKETDVRGQIFDFEHPDQSLTLPSGAGVLTWGALEQVGDRFEPFMGWLRRRDPQVVVHVEPIVDWYDENLMVDEIGIRYHEKRGYLKEFWPALQDLEAAGEIEILQARRLRFGSLFHEVYSYIVWRPKSSNRNHRD